MCVWVLQREETLSCGGGEQALSIVSLDDRQWVTGAGDAADETMTEAPRVRMGHAVVAVSKSKVRRPAIPSIPI